MMARGASAEYRGPHTSAAIDASDPLRAVVRFADGASTKQDVELLQKGFDAYINAGGAIPMEKCLGIPATHTGWRKLRRDAWLCRAASLIDADGSRTGAAKLKAEWDKFISRGPWNAWRDDGDPPAGAHPLHEALFYATRYNRSESLAARHIARIVGHIFTGKCP